MKSLTMMPPTNPELVALFSEAGVPMAISMPFIEADLALLPGLIALATFILEDAATVAAGLLAGQGVLMPLVAFIALYVGIVLGDWGLYGLGRLAACRPWLARHMPQSWTEGATRHLGGHLIKSVLGARAVPGLRLTTYTLAGWLGLPFARFAAATALAAFLWTLPVFLIVACFGAAVLAQAPIWLIGLSALAGTLVLTLLPHGLRRLLARRAA